MQLNRSQISYSNTIPIVSIKRSKDKVMLISICQKGKETLKGKAKE